MSLLPGYPQPIPPYRHPVPPVGIDPDADPLIQICVNESWLAYIIGALKSLQLVATWDTNDPAEMQDQIERSNLLLALCSEAIQGCANPPDILCIEGSFSDTTYGFTAAQAAPCIPDWTFGDGWESCFYNTGGVGNIALIERIFNAETFIRSVKVTVGGVAADTFTVTVTFFYHGAITYSASQTFIGAGSFDFTDNVNQPADAMLIDVEDTVAIHTADLKIFAFGFCYTGAFPLAQPPTTWEITKDFTASDGGFVAVNGGDGLPRGVYTAGVGWTKCTATPCVAANNSELRFKKTLASPARITSVEFFYSTGVDLTSGGIFTFTLGLNLPASSSDVTIPCDITTADMRMDLCCGPFSNNITVSKMIFHGLGIAPSDL